MTTFFAEKGVARSGFLHNYRPVQPLNGRPITTGFFKAAGEPIEAFQMAVSERIQKINRLGASSASSSKSVAASRAKLGSSKSSGAVTPSAGMGSAMIGGIVAACVGVLLIVAALVFGRRQKRAASQKEGRDLEAMGLTPEEYGRPDLVTTAHL